MRQPDRPLALLELSPEVAAHLHVALQLHKKWARESGMSRPPEFAQLEDAFAIRATRGLPGSALPDPWAFRESSSVPTKLVTREDAARVLSVSVTTLKRLDRAGVLCSVHVQGSTRYRVGDLDAYVEALAGDGLKDDPSATTLKDVS